MKCNIVRKINKINKNILILFIITICFMTNIKIVKADEKNVIKVGYPIINGFTEFKDGKYSGYAYEYLREIAKHTGWEYEFVEMSLNDMIYALKDGKIDLAAGMIKNEQTTQMYDFPEYNIGFTYTTLSVLNDNKNIIQSDNSTLDGIKVGYYESSKTRLEEFLKFCEINNIDNIEIVPYKSEEGIVLSDKLKSKEVDAIIDGDLLMSEGEKVIARFGKMPYYLATTKGNKEIISKLNDAIFKIDYMNHGFAEALYNKYFQINDDVSVSLTKEEKEYCENMNTLKAVYVDDYDPMQDYNDNIKSEKGIFIDIFKLICKKAGLKYEFIRVNNNEEGYEMIKNKEADLMIAVPSEYQLADKYDITLTATYLHLGMVNVVRKDNDTSEKKIVAMPRGYAIIEDYENIQVDIYDTIEDCIKAVSEGKAHIAYGNEYNVSYYMSIGYYPNLRIITDEYKKPAAIGLTKSTNQNLISILNKAIYSLSEDEIQDIIYENTVNINHNVTLKEVVYENIVLVSTIVIVVLLIICTMIFTIVKMKFDKVKEDKNALFRKTQIDTLTDVYNREACERLVKEYLDTKDSSKYGSFMIIDIDYFKQVNDSLGHRIGDKVLIEFGRLLKEFFDHNDVVSRIGGDEFIVFMKDIEKDNLEKINEKLQKLCKIMNKKVEYNDKSQNISLSIGAIITNENIEFSTLYSRADEMLYEVKRQGKNGFKVRAI